MESHRAINIITQTTLIEMHFFSFFQSVAMSLIAHDNYDSIKKQKRCIICIHLITDDGLYDRKALYKVKNCFYLLFMIDNEFIN